MGHVKRAWCYLIVEPFTWVFYCFFQPGRFKRDFEVEGFFKRVIPMVRLLLPMFLISYPLAFTVKIILYHFFPELAPCCFSTTAAVVLGPDLVILLLASLEATITSFAFAILCGAVGGLAFGITFGSLVGAAFSAVFGIVGKAALSIASGIALGVAFGIAGGLLSVIARSISRGVNVGIAGFLVFGIVGAIALAIAGSIINSVRAGFASSVAGAIALAIAASIAFSILWLTRRDARVGLTVYIVLAIVGATALAIALYIIQGTRISIVPNALYLTGSTRLGTVAGIVGGLAGGLVGGLVLGTLLGMTGVLTGGVAALIVGSIAGGIKLGIIFSSTLTVSYIVGYYRLPLYPVSALSALGAYVDSRKNPLQVFICLRHSSLYWDERVFLPLPYLRRILLIAADQDVKQALDEIAFIAAERTQQIGAARVASLEIAMRDLETRENLREIAGASQRLTEILPREAGLIDPKWVTPFARLNDASRDADRYCSPLGWQARYNALEDMIANLRRIHPNTAFEDARLNKRLGAVVDRWRLAALNEQEKLEQAPETIGQIANPYIPGPALELRNSLFVGRWDLVQQLGEALGKGSLRPTFFLNGERRMGKSSTLKQLPHLLGARYLPITYDLQMRGISSSAAAFLATVAGEITKMMNANGMQIKKLEFVRLKEAGRENEAVVYYLFDEWFELLEPMLEREDRTLLLLFDEFEKLEEAEQEGYLNLKLLLDWFRSVIQNRPRLALLFSGIRSLGEMGANWAGYFVNVQTLRVSFLRVSEARQLIMQPTLNFPSELVFGENVVEEIMRVTGCHPFLVQAICSALIDNLNAENRDRAEGVDVRVAMNQVLENWWDTYFRDMWERTDQEQRACLIAVRSLGIGDPQKIVQLSGLDERAVRSSLQMLLKRDVIRLEDGSYCVATPIFSEWIERNS